MTEIGAFRVMQEGKRQKTHTRFTFLTGDMNWQTYGGKFVSKKLNNGDFDYWLVMNVINMWDATGDENQDKYVIELLAISPSQVSEKELDAAFSSMGLSDEQMERLENDPMIQVEALAEYGIFAMLWSNSGNNLDKLIKEAHLQADMCNTLFGFYMDRPENLIGSMGWDCISGDIDRPLREYSDNAE